MNVIGHSQQHRCAKIVATLGPATDTVEAILDLAKAGANVFRLNFSHGTFDDHAARIAAVRKAEELFGRPLGMFMDLQGPKFRIGAFADGPVELKVGQSFIFDTDDVPGNAERVTLPHPEIFEALSVGDRLLLDDGRMRLKVIEISPDRMVAEALVDGKLSDRKGLNLPDAEIKVSALTEKDRADLAFGLEQGVSSVALSFVQRPEDMIELRELTGPRVQLIAKIEKPTALSQLSGIVEQSDAVMVARGDLGVELPPERVPALQKHIISTARGFGRPVIVATQMLETMIEAPTPTRAEASDVASAVYDGADAVMLSAETAAGKYPTEAVAMMNRIISEVESDPLHTSLMDASRGTSQSNNTDAISAAARQVASTLEAKAIICYSTSGKTALRAARERPEAPIISLTYDLSVARALCLVWGIKPIVSPDVDNIKEMVEAALRVSEEKEMVAKGDTVVITAGVPFGNAGTTNILRIAEVGES
ncbi:pyruvate kinase [Terasakiella sp. A23]|uniref:pyruvate kinase n=1 Tax=Terasakiella sp. FCG-A23 TaxID=3080561 RepID=UPI00295493E4|nr:pyruvate kinase [Terasakiella sp. A23]MDV7341085.1 pyruvate kinase [Terasakiella sp. A23]